MLMRFDPFRDFDRLAQVLSQQSGSPRSSSMPMDAYREGDRLVVQFDLPGVDPGSIELVTERNVLTVRAERTWQPSDGQEVVIAERPHGTFTRQLFLGDSLDPDGITATYDKGVLTITIPVSERAKPRRVEINTASETAQRIEAGAGARTTSAQSGQQAGQSVEAGATSGSRSGGGP